MARPRPARARMQRELGRRITLVVVVATTIAAGTAADFSFPLATLFSSFRRRRRSFLFLLRGLLFESVLKGWGVVVLCRKSKREEDEEEEDNKRRKANTEKECADLRFCGSEAAPQRVVNTSFRVPHQPPGKSDSKCRVSFVSVRPPPAPASQPASPVSKSLSVCMRSYLNGPDDGPVAEVGGEGHPALGQSDEAEAEGPNV